MFKVVTEFVPSPIYMMVCDHPRCSQVITGNVQPGLEMAPGAQMEFINQVQSKGWYVRLCSQFCPPHNPDAVRDKLILIPDLVNAKRN